VIGQINFQRKIWKLNNYYSFKNRGFEGFRGQIVNNTFFKLKYINTKYHNTNYINTVSEVCCVLDKILIRCIYNYSFLKLAYAIFTNI